jgi:hypothetical protein
MGFLTAYMDMKAVHLLYPLLCRIEMGGSIFLF